MSERSIFQSASEMADPSERAAYLDRACGGNPALRGRVDALLAAAERTGSFMERPAPELLPPTAQEPWPADQTTPDRGNAAGGLRLDPVPGSRQGDDVPALWRKRLLFLSSLNLAIVAAYAATFLPQYPNSRSVSLYAALFVLNAGLVTVLRGRRTISLPSLRRLEVVLFTCLAAYFSLVQYRLLAQGWVGRLAPYDWEGMFLLARGLNSLWFALIIAYGLLIPNTWRRAAGFVGGMALCPVLVNARMALADSEVGPRLTALFLVETVINIGIGSALAVYGSHRIEVLRRQAAEARQLGQYQLKRRLGAGGMGEVWLAEHVLLRRPCAVKLIRPERVGDPRARRRFEREVQVTATLSHPNTVEVYDYGKADDGTFYYAWSISPA